jgi:hypothetical protein
MSARGDSSISGGTTSFLSMAHIPQYSSEIRTSSGAVHKARLFLIKNDVGESVRSATRPKMQVRVATASPRMVNNCQCHWESLACKFS